ncbi:MAG: azurin [Verrucomicrobiota bacterium]
MKQLISFIIMAASVAVVSGGEVKIELGSNDMMQFDKTELRVPAGSKVTLTLNHTGKLPKQAMGHNFVLLKAGTDLAAFGAKSAAAAATEYIPEGDEVIAHTKLIGGGASATISFTAPAAGTYDFICSFPGHYAIMKGKLIVE